MKKGSHHTEEAINKNRLAHLGKKRSAEALEKQSRTMLELWKKRGPHTIAEIEQIRRKLLGHPVSLESRLKNRLAHLGKRPSEETRRKRGLALKGNRNGFAKGDKPWNTGLTKNVEPRLINISGWKGKTFCDAHKAKLKVARASQVMPFKDTAPERSVQSILGELHIPFKTHVPIFLGKSFHQVDILIEPKIVIEVQGCWWHQCRLCGFDTGYNGMSAEGIRKHDEDIYSLLTAKTFVVHRIWEHETKNLPQLRNRIQQTFLLKQEMTIGH